MTTTAADFARCQNPNCGKSCWVGVLKEHEGMRLCPKCWPHRAHISKGKSKKN